MSQNTTRDMEDTADTSPELVSTLPRSHLLKDLPQELRLMIYEQVLGNTTIHVTVSRPGTACDLGRRPKIHCVVCDVPNKENETYKLSLTNNSDKHAKPMIEDYRHRHRHCLNTLSCIKDHDHRRGMRRHFWKPCSYMAFDDLGYDLFLMDVTPVARPKLSLDLLLVCRQIYSEARLIPFSSNVFAFETNDDQALATNYFLLEAQRAAIRKVMIYQREIDLPRLQSMTALFDRLGSIEISTSKHLSQAAMDVLATTNWNGAFIRKARVIVGSDEAADDTDKSERGKQAKAVEDYFTSSYIRLPAFA